MKKIIDTDAVFFDHTQIAVNSAIGILEDFSSSVDAPYSERVIARAQVIATLALTFAVLGIFSEIQGREP
jgi:hypothetical protein